MLLLHELTWSTTQRSNKTGLVLLPSLSTKLTVCVLRYVFFLDRFRHNDLRHKRTILLPLTERILGYIYICIYAREMSYRKYGTLVKTKPTPTMGTQVGFN